MTRSKNTIKRHIGWYKARTKLQCLSVINYSQMKVRFDYIVIPFFKVLIESATCDLEVNSLEFEKFAFMKTAEVT